MKKFLFMLSAVLLMAVGTTLTSCKHSKTDAPPDIVKCLAILSQGYTGTDAAFNVENILSADREFMFTYFGADYKWYETSILLSDYLDAKDADGTIAGVSNVFYVVNQLDGSYDSFAQLIAHTPIYYTTEAKHGIWVGDFPLNDTPINLTYKQAYEKVMASNFPKPHSRNCVLRREIGPIPDVPPNTSSAIPNHNSTSMLSQVPSPTITLPSRPTSLSVPLPRTSLL